MNGKKLYEAIDLVKDEYINEVYSTDSKNKITKKKLLLLILAATMAISILTACVAEIYKWDGRLSQMLNLTSEQIKLVEGMWYKINKSKTSKGITVTLDSILADDNSMFVLYDMKLQETIDMDRVYYFESTEISGQEWFSYSGSMSSATISPIEGKVDKEKNTITVLLQYSADRGSIKEQKIRFAFNNLRSCRYVNDIMVDDRLEEPVEIVFYSDLRYTPKVINYSLDKPITGVLNSLTVENITITPLSLTINASGESQLNLWNIDTKEHEKDFISSVILKNGTEVKLHNQSTSYLGEKLTYKTIFEEVVDPSEIGELVFLENEKVSLSGLEATTGVESINSSYKMSKKILELTIFINILIITVGAVYSLQFCKGDVYKYFEKIQEKKKGRGKEYSFDKFIIDYKRDLIITEITDILLLFMLMLAVCQLTYLIIINCFLIMTVFMDCIFIGLMALLIITIKDCRKKRKILI